MNRNIATVFQASRPNFLVLGPVCVLLGISLAYNKSSEIDLWIGVLCIIVAVFGHIGVNLFNEYEDAKSGLDEHTQRTPFSGGSGALQNNPSALRAVFFSGVIALSIAALVGVYIALQISVSLLILGFIGLILIVSYTPWLNKLPWLCLVAPGLGFGLLMVTGTYFALTGKVTWVSLLIAVPVFALSNNLLLLNQFPDVQADKAAGRNHFVICYGFQHSALVYFAFAMLTHLSIALMIASGALPSISSIAFIGLPLGLLIALKARSFEPSNIEAFLPFMGMNVALTLILPLILCVSLFIA
jgi:1,4-dihydroxy-2-naphthoate octaprenyltransferase